MGIKGLTSYLNSKHPSLGPMTRLWTDDKDCRTFVIDGDALIHHVFGTAAGALRVPMGSGKDFFSFVGLVRASDGCGNKI